MLIDTLFNKHLTIIDIGSGRGFFTKSIVSKFAFVVSIDNNPRRVEYLRSYMNENKIENIEIKIMDATKLEFPDNFFDISASYCALDHITNYESAVKEMIRVVKRKGHIYICNSQIESPQSEIKNSVDLRNLMDDLLEINGLGDGQSTLSDVYYEDVRSVLLNNNVVITESKVTNSSVTKSLEALSRLKKDIEKQLDILSERDKTLFKRFNAQYKNYLNNIKAGGFLLPPKYEIIGEKTL